MTGIIIQTGPTSFMQVGPVPAGAKCATVRWTGGPGAKVRAFVDGVEVNVKQPRRRNALVDLTGKRFGKWTVLSRGENDRHKNVRWICRCDCGEESLVLALGLKGGASTGCRRCGNAQMAIGRITHGQAAHERRTPEYSAWAAMIGRCTNPKYRSFASYGARGIVVCERWAKSFTDFFADMGKRPTSRHSIERIDNNGNYEPGNCRWATDKEQCRNTRQNRIVEYRGEKMCLTELAELTGIAYEKIRHLIRYRKMTADAAVSKLQ